MNTVKFVLYLLAILTSLGCTVLLFRGYAQKGVRLLFWSSLCFIGLTLNNVFLFLDFLVPTVDFRPARLIAAMIGMLFLLYGFIWETE